MGFKIRTSFFRGSDYVETGKAARTAALPDVFVFTLLRLVVWFKMTRTMKCNNPAVTGAGVDKVCPHHFL